jgi:hypothetical protein
LNKRKNPNDPGMGSNMQAGRNYVAPKVENKVAKGRG